jgi:hypothetical protein
MNFEAEIESGNFLFKFCRFNTNALQILINNTLYFSAPNNLNDPLDSRFSLKIANPLNFSSKTRESILNSRFFLSEEIIHLVKDIGSDLGRPSSQEKLFNEYFKHLQNTYFGICCFSMLYKEHLLWTHYTDETKGLCFVFDKDLLIDSIRKNIPRKYELIHRPLTYRGVKKLEVTLYRDGRIRQTINHLFSKTKHWRYEKEYRFVLTQDPRKFGDIVPERFDPYLVFDENCLK